MSLVQPLELQRRLRTPPTGPDVAALIDIMLIAFMLSLLGSRFVYSPGTTLGLEDLELPVSSASQLTGAPTVDVLTLLQDDRLIYGGQFMTAEDWSRKVAEGDIEGRRESKAILLIKADGRISLEAFLRICDRAREAGYARLQIAERPAAKPKPRNEAQLQPTEPAP